MSNLKSLIVGYWILVIGLFLYSYTQVDLNLTLSQWSIWQIIQKSFQYIGWFNRPLSTGIYTALILLFTVYYLLFLWFVKKNKLSIRQFWWLILITSAILLFSYNAFSYDLFNYMFDAKIFTFHHQNPYLHRALDYPQDPWINFMRWTHRTYPYGPLWLGLTIPISFLGMQVFLPTLFLFKMLMAGSFVGTTYFIGKILEKISPNEKLFAMAFFALNPLVIIESLVSAHNDIVMIFLAVFSIYLLMNNNYYRSFLLLILSIAVKFSTVFLIPINLVVFSLYKKKKKINWEVIFILMSALMVIPIFLVSIRTNFQPWYLLYILPFAAVVSKKYYIFIPCVIISLFALLQYLPFLYLGNWNPPVASILTMITASSIIFSLLIVLVRTLMLK